MALTSAYRATPLRIWLEFDLKIIVKTSALDSDNFKISRKLRSNQQLKHQLWLTTAREEPADCTFERSSPLLVVQIPSLKRRMPPVQSPHPFDSCEPPLHSNSSSAMATVDKNRWMTSSTSTAFVLDSKNEWKCVNRTNLESCSQSESWVECQAY